jgi:hypothetical protein
LHVFENCLPQHPSNIFINYPPKGPGRIPKAGLESNAFPEIVVGDFGAAAIEGDDPTALDHSRYHSPTGEPDRHGFLEDWEDIFSVGEALREMAMTHIPYQGFNDDHRPSDWTMQEASQYPVEAPYSEELVKLLEQFEYPNMNREEVRDLRGAVYTTFPSPEELRDVYLPQAQARVAAFRNPAQRPAGYYDGLDVSWTRPGELFPFSYIMEYAGYAGEMPDGSTPSGPDSESGGEDDGGPPSSPAAGDSEGSGSDGGDGEDEDIEIADAPEEENDDSAQPPDRPQQPEGSGDSGDPDDGDDDNDNDQNTSNSGSSPSPSQSNSGQLAMHELRKMHKWNRAKPRYVLRSLEYRTPTIMPFNHGP